MRCPLLRWTHALLPVLLVATPAVAAPQDTSAEDAVAAVIKKLEDARAEFMVQWRAASEEEQTTLRDQYPSGEDLIPEMWAVIEQHAGAEACADGLSWLVETDKPAGSARAYGMLFEHFPDDGRVTALMGRLRPHPAVLDVLRRANKNESVTIRAHSTYNLAKLLGDVPTIAARLEGMSDDDVKGYTAFYGEEAIAYSRTSDADKLREEAEQLLNKVIADEELSAVVLYRDRTIGKLAAGDLFEMKNLREGLVAPEIEGEDIDGVQFKLSDYRGKVVFLDFWGDW